MTTPTEPTATTTPAEATAAATTGTPTTPATNPDNEPTNGEPDPDAGEDGTFPRTYVEQLRRESAEHRTRAKRADELESRLLATIIREATSEILEDPEDLWRGHETADFLDDDGYPDESKVRTAAEDLARSKPHLAKRRAAGDVDQGARSEPPEPVSLAGILRERAG